MNTCRLPEDIVRSIGDYLCRYDEPSHSSVYYSHLIDYVNWLSTTKTLYSKQKIEYLYNVFRFMQKYNKQQHEYDIEFSYQNPNEQIVDSIV